MVDSERGSPMPGPGRYKQGPHRRWEEAGGERRVERRRRRGQGGWGETWGSGRKLRDRMWTTRDKHPSGHLVIAASPDRFHDRSPHFPEKRLSNRGL